MKFTTPEIERIVLVSEAVMSNLDIEVVSGESDDF